MNWASQDRKATQVKRAKPVQQAPQDYLELRPCSPRTRECQGNPVQKETRGIVARPGNRAHRAVLENWGLPELLDHRVPRDKKAHVGCREQLETPALLDL